MYMYMYIYIYIYTYMYVYTLHFNYISFTAYSIYVCMPGGLLGRTSVVRCHAHISTCHVTHRHASRIVHPMPMPCLHHMSYRVMSHVAHHAPRRIVSRRIVRHARHAVLRPQYIYIYIGIDLY